MYDTNANVVKLVTKPVVGVLDGVNFTLTCLRNESSLDDMAQRVRLPRHVRHDGVILPYSPHEAVGAEILRAAIASKNNADLVRIVTSSSKTSGHRGLSCTTLMAAFPAFFARALSKPTR